MTLKWDQDSVDRIDFVGHSTQAIVEKWDEDQVSFAKRKLGWSSLHPDLSAVNLRRIILPYEVRMDNTPNLTTSGGLARLTSSLTGATPVVFSDTTTTVLGVGSSSTAEAVANTDLTAALWWQKADTGSPSRVTTTVANDSIQVVATFASANANGAWNEWGLGLVTTAVSAATLATAGTGGLLFNHKTATLGTKVSGSTWAFTVKLTWS